MGKPKAQTRHLRKVRKQQDAVGRAPRRYKETSKHQAVPQQQEQQSEQQQEPQSEQQQPASPAEQQQQPAPPASPLHPHGPACMEPLADAFARMTPRSKSAVAQVLIEQQQQQQQPPPQQPPEQSQQRPALIAEQQQQQHQQPASPTSLGHNLAEDTVARMTPRTKSYVAQLQQQHEEQQAAAAAKAAAAAAAEKEEYEKLAAGLHARLQSTQRQKDQEVQRLEKLLSAAHSQISHLATQLTEATAKAEHLQRHTEELQVNQEVQEAAAATQKTGAPRQQ
ncbi:hypothetical protein DUNSADRAFT_15678 [Dunaliella salina]|uniref:Uncharacterized protein n=1 Tax=Dunaliella salina TaxID=3046 RepID=A0ABQ7G4X3_DUNSA|nr:hypothetical protein DUNSADRAFT_15678 [Dunaliella salina]|eukprot:KAF5829653.1 hypothetical protein DUNSADRAFT_15678 [Dunaliella salina]